MAERRMFAKSVIGSARFLTMPPSSRLLYYDLGMAADDDGIVEAFAVMRLTGAFEDDLKVLVSKGFVSVLNEELVSLITDWSRNNQIRQDRYRPSIYRDLLVKFDLLDQRLPSGLPDGNQRLTEYSTGKGSKDKLSKEECMAPPAAEPAPAPDPPAKEKKQKHGQYGWVKLTATEYSRLLDDLGQAELDRCVRYIDESAQGNGNKNKWKDWNLVIRRCHREKWGCNMRTEVQHGKPAINTDKRPEIGLYL